MKKLYILSLWSLFLISVVGCAATYKAPVTPSVDFIRDIQGAKQDIFNKAKQVLVMEGYQIQSSDKNAGVITTSFRQIRLKVTQADCGTTMGLPYIKDNRTVTNVSMGIVIDENQISIKANITGEYLKGADVVQSITFDCISIGTIEQGLFDKIKSKLN